MSRTLRAASWLCHAGLTGIDEAEMICDLLEEDDVLEDELKEASRQLSYLNSELPQLTLAQSCLQQFPFLKGRFSSSRRPHVHG